MRMLIPMTCTAPARWNAFRELEDQLDRVWDGLRGTPGESVAWIPPVDVHEGKDAFTLEADLPGINKEDIEVSLDNGLVTLKGSRKKEIEKDGDGYHRVERTYGRFERSFRLPDGVDASQVTAAFDKGVLRLTLPKSEAAKPKQIQVHVS